MKIGIIGAGKFGLVLARIAAEQMKLNHLIQKMKAYQDSLLMGWLYQQHKILIA